MKHRFPQFYVDTENGKEKALKEGVIFLDTNILIHFFRLGKEFGETLFKLLELVKDRTFIPFHVAEEYHPKYKEICVHTVRNYENAIREIEKMESPFQLLKKKNEEFTRHLKKDFIKKENDRFQGCKNKISAHYSDCIKFLREEITSEKIFNRIGDFFEGKILDGFADDELEKIAEEGEERYEAKIPPGYMDRNKRTNPFGDLIIWKEMMSFMKGREEGFAVFISDDLKEDWLRIIDGERHGPRVELISEFNHETGKDIYLMSADAFIQNVQKAYNIKSDKTSRKAMEASSLFQEMMRKVETEFVLPDDKYIDKYIDYLEEDFPEETD